jgi:NADH-quinone oxidoreductase subunit E
VERGGYGSVNTPTNEPDDLPETKEDGQ